MAELAGLESLSASVDPVARRFADAGHRLYLVGGVVRDLVLGDTPLDIDLTTAAEPGEIKRLLAPIADALWSQGERFGTIGATVAGRALEVTTHRAEAYDPDSRNPTVTFGRDLLEDLSRRDFTINAMAIELPSRELHDPYHGLVDLEARRLRTPLSPEVSFGDDPLRMLRAVRFVARFGLDPAPELLAAAAAYADRLAIVSVERIADELERLLALTDPGVGLALFVRTGLLASAVTAFADEPAEAGKRAAAIAGALPATDPVARRAGLLWPVRDRADAELSRLRYAKRERQRTVRLIEAAADLLTAAQPDPIVRRFAASAGVDDVSHLRSLLTVVDPAAGRAAAERLDALDAVEDLGDLDSPLSAAEIMSILDLDPGPAVGKAQRHLRDYRLDHGPMAAEDARRILADWWRQERGGADSLPWSP